MRFGEFIRIVPTDEVRRALRLGPDRQLHEIDRPQRAIDQRQSFRMHHVLGIVKHEAAKAPVRSHFVLAQRAVQAVEAIRFGRRAGLVVNHEPHAMIGSGRGDRGCQRRLVVGVQPDIKGEFVVPPGVQSVADHRPDHFGFPPGRHEDRRGSG
jgi:hypothetical protein